MTMRLTSVLFLALSSMASVAAFAPTRTIIPTTASTFSFSSSKSSGSRSVSLSLLGDPDMMHSLLQENSVAVAEGIRDIAIFKGKTLSLLHPVMMLGLLGFSLSTGLLGLQWRRQRTLGDEISALKKTMPAVAEGEAPTPAALAIQTQVDELTAERKQLAAEGPRDKHFSQGSLLAFLGTLFAIEVSVENMQGVLRDRQSVCVQYAFLSVSSLCIMHLCLH